MLRSLELFAGIVGIGLGLEMAGCAAPAAFCEIDPFARAVQRKHYPEVRQYDDVRTLSADALDRDGITGIHLITGGFPCQPHSTAGKRLASADERDLWGEFARLIGEIKPRWVVAENVPGLLSSADPAHGRGKGGFFLRVLRDLAALGYDAEWCTFPAAAVGAHHLRNRVWIVAHAPQLFSNGRANYSAGDREGAWPFSEPGNGCSPAHVAHSDGTGLSGRVGERGSETEYTDASLCRPDVAHAMRSGRGEQHTPAQPGWAGHRAGRGHAPDWAGGAWEQPSPTTFSAVRGVADGLPGRVDRLRTLGNAVVPQQAQVIGEAIKDAEAYWRQFGVMPPQIVRPEHIERVRRAE